MSEADRMLDMHWSNDYDLYRAVLDFARDVLRRVPDMNDLTLGTNVRDTLQRWCADESAFRQLGWQRTSYVVDARVLRMMRQEVERAGGFRDVSSTLLGETVREGLDIEA